MRLCPTGILILFALSDTAGSKRESRKATNNIYLYQSWSVYVWIPFSVGFRSPERYLWWYTLSIHNESVSIRYLRAPCGFDFMWIWRVSNHQHSRRVENGSKTGRVFIEWVGFFLKLLFVFEFRSALGHTREHLRNVIERASSFIANPRMVIFVNKYLSSECEFSLSLYYHGNTIEHKRFRDCWSDMFENISYRRRRTNVV